MLSKARINNDRSIFFFFIVLIPFKYFIFGIIDRIS